MAPSRRQRPARDRIAAAQHQLDTAAGVWRVHLKVCAQCHRAGSRYQLLCDEGWTLVKDLTRARSRLQRLTEQAAAQGVQVALW